MVVPEATQAVGFLSRCAANGRWQENSQCVSSTAILPNVNVERDSAGYDASIDVPGWGIGQVCGGWQRPPWLVCSIGRAAFYEAKSMECRCVRNSSFEAMWILRLYWKPKR